MFSDQRPRPSDRQRTHTALRADPCLHPRAGHTAHSRGQRGVRTARGCHHDVGLSDPCQCTMASRSAGVTDRHPRLSHWHHTLAEPRDRNYASMLPCMDWIFGTYYLPRKQWPSAYGTEAKLPASPGGQFPYPLGLQLPRSGLTGVRGDGSVAGRTSNRGRRRESYWRSYLTTRRTRPHSPGCTT